MEEVTTKPGFDKVLDFAANIAETATSYRKNRLRRDNENIRQNIITSTEKANAAAASSQAILEGVKEVGRLREVANRPDQLFAGGSFYQIQKAIDSKVTQTVVNYSYNAEMEALAAKKRKIKNNQAFYEKQNIFGESK